MWLSQWSNSSSYNSTYTCRVTWPISFGANADYEAVVTGSIYGADTTYNFTNNMIYNAHAPAYCDFRSNYSAAPSLRGIAIGV